MTPEYGGSLGPAEGVVLQAKAWRLVTRPSLMAAPRHHACAVHKKETTSGRADLRIDEEIEYDSGSCAAAGPGL
jgi:hypothetical protein